jgi:alcohol dehydrogenase class IV
MLLAKTLAYIADGALDRFASLGRAIGVATDADIDAVATEKFLAAVDALCATCKVPTLAEYGIDRDAFFARMDKMATDALASGSPANTRKTLDKDDLLRIYESLWD